MKPKLSILTVTYNSQRFIQGYLSSLSKIKVSYEVIIVDNNSQDETADILKKRSNIKFLPQTTNLGFSKANNLAAKYAQGEFLFFLNPDTEVTTDISEGIDYLESHPEVGIVAPKLVNSEAVTQPSVRRLPTIIGAVKEYWFKMKNSYREYSPKSLDPTEVESVVGGAVIIPKTVFLKIRGWDERYFLYFEDLELCKNIRQAGYKIIYYPKIVLRHEIGASARTNSKANQYLSQGSQIYHGLIKSYILYFVIRLAQILHI